VRSAKRGLSVSGIARPIEKADVLAAMDDAGSSVEGDLWLLAQSPIVHVACRSVEKATVLLRLAIESGSNTAA
jgi:tRNA(Phe) wybutosine-synthesizing methylase Tyw3